MTMLAPKTRAFQATLASDNFAQALLSGGLPPINCLVQALEDRIPAYAATFEQLGR